MQVPFLDIKAQYQEVKTETDPPLPEILSTGAYVLGKYNKQLEEGVAGLHGVKHGVAVNSGTDALRIALQAAGIGAGDEVITTAFTFVASIEVVAQLGGVPVFVDIEPDTFNIDPAKVEAAITPKTKAILPIHLFGQLVDVEAIGDIAKRHGLVVIEDAAQAIGSHHSGVCAGNFSAAAGVSFYVTKNLGAAGDGGMVLTNDDEVADRCRSLRVHGMGRERYYYDEIGYTSRMAELQAAVLCAKLPKLPEWNAKRDAVAQTYLREMKAPGVTLPVVAAGNNHTWHQFTVRSSKRDPLMAYLKERGIASAVYYPVPLHLHKPYAGFGGGQGSLPETERAALEVLSLPVHQYLTAEQIQHVIASVNAFAG